MPDFHQTGVITSLHRLGKSDLPRLESELLEYSDERPIALVLPSLFSETRGSALKGIVEELARVPYLHQCVVSLSGQADLVSRNNASKLVPGAPFAPARLKNSSREIRLLPQQMLMLPQQMLLLAQEML